MLRIQCFGQFAVRRGEEPVGGSAMQPRRLAVLAILARAGNRGIPRDAVLRLLWPDEEEEKARRLLSQAIYMLRRDLGSEEAIDGGRVLSLSQSEISSDVQAFERAIAERRFAEAVRLYTGPFLGGFTLQSSPEFMRWVDDARDSLALVFASAVELAAAESTAKGDTAAALTLWRRRAGLDALDGRVAMRLMEALEQAGDRAGAIRHASIYAALVEQELKSPCDAAVLALAESIKRRAVPVMPATAKFETLPSLPVMNGPAASAKAPAENANSATDSDIAANNTANRPSESKDAPTAANIDALFAEHPRSKPAVLLTQTEQHRVQVAWRKGAGALVAALLLVAGMFAWRRSKAPLFDERRVLVTPLANRTGDRTLDPYGMMIAEWITQGLSNSGLVQVVDARSMVEIMRDVPASGLLGNDSGATVSRDIATRLKAGLVVSGTIYKSGDSLLVQVRVVNPHTSAVRATVPAMRVDAANATAALEPLRQRVTGVLALLLDTRLAHTGATGSEPPTFDAYAEYLQGIQLFGRDYPKALEHLIRASKLDTTFRQARLWTAMAFANTRRYRESDSTFNLVDRKRLAPYDQANFDYFRAGFTHGDWQRSYESAKRMLELAPQATHARYAIGLTAIFTLRVQEGIDTLGTINLTHGFGQEWAPRILALRLRGYETLGDYEEALLLGKQLRELDPAAGWQRVPELRTLARTHAGTGGASLFSRRLREAMALPPSTTGWEPFDPGDMLNQVALAARFVGDTMLADSLWRAAATWYDARSAEDRVRPFVHRGHARVLYALGNLAGALDLYRALDASPAGVPEDRGMLGVIALRSGDSATALRTAKALEADTTPYRFGQQRAWAARIAALLNNPEWVAQLLYRARREGYTRQWEAQVDPSFTRLRNHPAFRDALAPFITDGIRGRTSRPQS